MIVKEVRHDMQVISHAALGSYMKHRGYTVRTLADAVDREVRKKNPRSIVSVSDSAVAP